MSSVFTLKTWETAKLPKVVWISANLPKRIALASPNLQKNNQFFDQIHICIIFEKCVQG